MTEEKSGAEVSAERLREVVLDLEVAKAHEQQLRQEATALLDGLKALTEATTPEEMFRRLLEALRGPLGFDAALVTRQIDEEDALVVDVSTDPVLMGARFPLGKTFRRALGGRVTTHIDTSVIPEWQAQPEEVRAQVGSALLLPLQGAVERALIVFTRREARAFQVRHEQLARRLLPLATQALRDVERTALIARSNRDMRVVLDNVEQGLLMVARDRTIVGERSAVVDLWFGPIAPGARLDDVIRAKDPVAAEWLAPAWECFVEDALPVELLLAQLPERIKLDDRVLRADYRPVPSLEAWTHVLVVFSDITLKLERERAEERQREFVAMVSGFMRDRRGFETFLEEADRLVQSLTTGGQLAETQFRALHTLKGNASLFALASFAAIAHGIEDLLGNEPLPASAFDPLVQAWQRIGEDLAPLRGGSGSIEVEPRELEALTEGLRRHADPEELLERVLSWRGEPVARRLERLAEQARVVAARLGKGKIGVEIDADDLRLEGEPWRAFFSNLVHALRNAVDHGLEDSAERTAAGKPATGRLVLRARRSAEGLTIAVSDDGRGIPWPRLAAIAAARGLPAATHEDLVESLFHDGISTKDEVTDVSGRGVGLAALRTAVRERGGRVEVTSEPGRGTTFSFLFPEHACRARRDLPTSHDDDTPGSRRHDMHAAP
jgi:HPt (histidine-containing phosphotransfer) domain-containing protein